jgi:hypothetical protein
MLLVGNWAAEQARAQENLDAGKSPSQIFAGTCNACHKSPRGLLKTVPPGSLSGFLRQHYTTSPNMAGVLANYLVSNGATDTRMPKEGSREAKQEAKGDAKPANPAEQLDRWGRRQHPATANQEPKGEPSARPDESEVPAQAAGSDGRKSAKQKMSRRGKPGAEEPPKAEATPLGDASKETAKESAAKEEAKPEPAKPEPAKPSAETPAQSANVEPAGETSMTRPDPVPPVTPAPAAEAPAPVATVPSGSSALAPATAATPLTSLPPATADVSAAAVGTTTEAPAVPLPSKPAPAPAVTAAAPTLPPVTPAGPPVPPTSQ